jgi:hypothetical protein
MKKQKVLEFEKWFRKHKNMGFRVSSFKFQESET